MPAKHINLLIEQGATWSHGWQPQINGAPVADATWAAKAQIRVSQDKASTLLYEWSTTIGNAAVDAQGVVTLSLIPADSQSWAFDEGFYDVEISHSGLTYRIAQGRVIVDREVTS